ncbi:hypothetical protein ACWCQL_37660 [Streptomyces sp. NPDC002073]
MWEQGPRRLWNEVADAYQWWDLAGRPGPERFGMSVTPHGVHTAWLDAPDLLVPSTG